MKRTCKLAAAALLTAAVTVGTVTACAAAETAVTTETYAYLPDHSVYFYDVDDGYSRSRASFRAGATICFIRGTRSRARISSLCSTAPTA